MLKFARMKRTLYIFCSLLLILLVGIGYESHKSMVFADNEEMVALHDAQDADTKDKLYDATPVPQKHEALLSSRFDTVHASSQRLRRTVPTAGYHPGNAAVKFTANNNLALLYMAKAGQMRLSALPQICLTVRYYVIALRHILR